MSHASGCFTYPFLHRGGTQVLHRGFDPKALLAELEGHGVTFLLLVPAMIYMLVDMVKAQAVDLSKLRTILYGGSRSEEHTSELQSLMRISYAVFCLKRKNGNKTGDKGRSKTRKH